MEIITSLDKGLQLLECIAHAGTPLTLAALSGEFPWHKSTIYRVLETLQHRGFVTHGSEGYLPGPALERMRGLQAGEDEILQGARRAMDLLAAETGENAHLAVFESDAVTFIDNANGGRFSLHTQVGSSEPLHCTALGKACLAAMTPQAAAKVLARLKYERFTPRTVRGIAELEQELGRARKSGYAIDDCEYSEHVRCAAAAIVTPGGRVVAMLGVSAPASRLTRKQAEKLGARCAELAQLASRGRWQELERAS